MVSTKGTVNFMFHHNWNYFLRVLYTDDTNNQEV